jgi:hypothetical protein
MEHVIQEGHTRGHLAAAAAIEIQDHVHVGLAGDAMDLAGAWRADGHAGRGDGPDPNHAKASLATPGVERYGRPPAPVVG